MDHSTEWPMIGASRSIAGAKPRDRRLPGGDLGRTTMSTVMLFAQSWRVPAEFVTEHALRPGYDYADEFEFGLSLILDALHPDE
jgi:hypothetical protein